MCLVDKSIIVCYDNKLHLVNVKEKKRRNSLAQDPVTDLTLKSFKS